MEDTKQEHRTSRDLESNKKEHQAHEFENALTPSDHSHDELVDAKDPEGHPAEAFQVHHKMNRKLFLSLTAMAFLWVGSQIPLYLYGSVLPLIYSDIGGVDRYVWFVIGYLIPNAALCPFVGALSDLFGRRVVAIVGQVLLIVGPIITATAHSMNIAIAGQVFSGFGAGLNELIALAGTAELVPVRKRGFYVGAIVFTILPFCPSVVYAQLIARASNWRYVGIPIGIWNFLGLLLIVFSYKDPPRMTSKKTRKDILRQIDYVGGLLSISGILCFMMGLQWGVQQYTWHSVHVLVPFILGIALIIAFFSWEIRFAPYPMAPKKMFSKAKRTMILILLITFFSGGNFFVVLLFWPTQIFNVYGWDPVQVGLRSLPIGFGIILGAFIALICIPLTKGRITHLMIFFTAVMTAFTGAISVGTPHNLPVMYALVTFASLGVGGVIIPSSIIAQICCPDELIATITAITLSIRYIGGAIGFTAYYNIFYDKFEHYGTTILVTDTIYDGVVPYPLFDPTLTPEQRTAYETALQTIAYLVGSAQYDQLKAYIKLNPLVAKKDQAFDLIIASSQEAFAKAYRYPYWMSIAFGGICLILSFGLGDIRRFLLTDRVAAAQASVPPAAEGAVRDEEK